VWGLTLERVAEGCAGWRESWGIHAHRGAEYTTVAGKMPEQKHQAKCESWLDCGAQMCCEVETQLVTPIGLMRERVAETLGG
jgi:hypothetical protein